MAVAKGRGVRGMRDVSQYELPVTRRVSSEGLIIVSNAVTVINDSVSCT